MEDDLNPKNSPQCFRHWRWDTQITVICPTPQQSEVMVWSVISFGCSFELFYRRRFLAEPWGSISPIYRCLAASLAYFTTRQLKEFFVMN
ncbi:hypothetical protein TNCV_1609481, partial [Trichonephila clavipes]